MLADALEERRAAVAATAAGAAPPGDAPPAPQDPEEALRVLMVRTLPPARRDGAPADARAKLVADVQRLEEPAAGEDLRFLDAWNVAYETVFPAGLPAAGDTAASFLARYARLLDLHLCRLRG
jgi:hypothetical protein